MYRITSLHVGTVVVEHAEPVFVWYVEGQGRKVLVDLGMPPGQTIQGRWGVPGEGGGPDALTAALAGIGVDPADIDTVLLTHLHFDHAWNIDLFPRAQVVVQREEIIHAIKPDPLQRGYFGREVNAKLIGRRQPDELLIVEGDWQAARGLALLLCPGHTPGIQGVLVETARGVVALASDVGEMYGNWFPADPRATDQPRRALGDTLLPPSIHSEAPRVCVASMARLKERSSIVVPAHDWRIPRRMPEEWWGIPPDDAGAPARWHGAQRSHRCTAPGCRHPIRTLRGQIVMMQRRYPEKKQRDLSDAEKAHLRERIQAGDADIYKLAQEFGCSSSQVAGVKAALSRS